MIDEIKRTLYAGIGAGTYTYEKLESSLRDLVDKGKITADEARATADKIVADSRKEFDKSSAELQAKFEKLLNKASVASQRDLEALTKRVAQLEKAVEELAEPKKKSS